MATLSPPQHRGLADVPVDGELDQVVFTHPPQPPKTVQVSTPIPAFLGVGED